MYEIVCPIKLPQTKTKNITLGLNWYRNVHFQTNNKMKKLFKETIRPQLEILPKLHKCSLHYEIYLPSKRYTDIDNIGSVVCKFTQDALVECGVLEGDDYRYISFISFGFGGIDKDNPRCVVTLNPQ